MQAITLFNRWFRWTPAGLELEACGEHVGLLPCEWGARDCNGVHAPTRNNCAEGRCREKEPTVMVMIQITAAITNYLAQGRGCFDVATQVWAHAMSSPHIENAHNLRRILRYLKGYARSVYFLVSKQCFGACPATSFNPSFAGLGRGSSARSRCPRLAGGRLLPHRSRATSARKRR